MEELKFITEEVLSYMHSQVSKNRYDIVSVSQMMPTFEGFLTPYLISELDGGKFDVNIEELYLNSDEYIDFYETLIIEIAKDILEKREKTL
jgi:hypothetical protein